MKKILLSVLILCVSISISWAQLPSGSKALFHTQTAKTINKGSLDIATNLNFYTKAGDFIGSSKPIDFSSANYWLVASNANFTYGVSDHFDATLGLRLYQDTHYTNEFNVPDDLFLTLRAGSFGFGRNHFNASIMTSFRFPIGEVHNYPFAEYASGAIEYGILGALSFYLDPYLPERAFNAHFNMGWWNHNEAGTSVYEFERNYGIYSEGDKLNGTVNSKDFRMALAAVYPTAMFDFRVELSGILYITQPDHFVYAGEEWAFLSPSIRYKAADWASFDIGTDLRLSPAERQWTSADIPDVSTNLDLPTNFPSWKIHMNANFTFDLLGKGLSAERNYERDEVTEKIQLFESIIEEREKADDVQEEIDNLRKLRKEAEKEIEDLKKILED